MRSIFFSFMLLGSFCFASWIEPTFQSCQFYERAEESVHCKEKGSDYLLGYGKHFCEEFKRKLPEWKERVRLKEWTESVGICLQEMMYDNRKKRISPCNQLEEFAFDAHPVCYKQYGVCKLSTKDLLSILNVVKGVHMFTRRSMAQIDNVILACLDEWISPEEKATYDQVYLGTQNQPEETKRLALQIFELAPADTQSKRRIFFRSMLPDLMFNFSSATSSKVTNAFISEYKGFYSVDGGTLGVRV